MRESEASCHLEVKMKRRPRDHTGHGSKVRDGRTIRMVHGASRTLTDTCRKKCKAYGSSNSPSSSSSTGNSQKEP
jgi:hypothetical protein